MLAAVAPDSPGMGMKGTIKIKCSKTRPPKAKIRKV